MTPAFWFVYGALLFVWVMQVVVTIRWRRLADGRAIELVNYEFKQAEFRAAYRDLITQYERLHTKYKELQRDSD